MSEMNVTKAPKMMIIACLLVFHITQFYCYCSLFLCAYVGGFDSPDIGNSEKHSSFSVDSKQKALFFLTKCFLNIPADLLTQAPGLSNGMSFAQSVASTKNTALVSKFDLSEMLFGEDAMINIPNPATDNKPVRA